MPTCEVEAYQSKDDKSNSGCDPWLVRGLLGTASPPPTDPTLESASPSPRQGSSWHRFNIDSTSIRHRFRVLLREGKCL